MESNYRGKVYKFTNENLESYKSIYNFNDANILSVVGSGDQYFASLLYGAKKIDLYDINKRAWDYFILKYYSILLLSYEEFSNFFVIEHLNNKKTYNKIKKYLPDEIKYNLDKFIKWNGNLSKMFFHSGIEDFRNYYSGRAIPYFDKDNYYKLQKILSYQELPDVYFYDLLDLCYLLKNKYDFVLTSNIFYYLDLDIDMYKKIISNLNSNVIQGTYAWGIGDTLKEEFLENGFIIDEIEGIIPDTKNYNLTLKK